MSAECRFTPEVRQKIPDWVRIGMSRREIASLIGIKESSLKVLCSRHQISLSRRHKRSFLVVLPEMVYQTLQDKAEQLCMSHRELSERVLEIVAKDDLFDALELMA